jgi:broad specificity phosphatase PhoE
MTTFYLVRHGTIDLLGHALAGRLPGVPLNSGGRFDARRLAERLQTAPIIHVISSPQERCRETAQPLAAALGLSIELTEALDEVDFGKWQGGTMSELSKDKSWRHWNSFRSGHAAPEGETMGGVQARMAAEMVLLRNRFPDQQIALFSHADPIRAVLCYWLGMPLDFIQRLEVAPGSFSEVAIDDDTAVVRRINVL